MGGAKTDGSLELTLPASLASQSFRSARNPISISRWRAIRKKLNINMTKQLEDLCNGDFKTRKKGIAEKLVR